LCKKASITSLWIVPCYLVVIHFVYLHDFISVLHGQPNIIQNPRSS
jgi:hypothetical protein